MTTEQERTEHRPIKSGYLPSLDGWRALAIFGVVLAHDRSWSIGSHSLNYVMGMGGYGVNLFFAISGFLITTRILEEEKLVGSFHIKRFYVRRLFRIQPAQFAYLLFIAALLAWRSGALRTIGFHDTWQTWSASLLLYVNFQNRAGSLNLVTGHFWTLAVEEHFYLLLSLLLFFVKRRRALVLGGLFLGFAVWMETTLDIHGAAWYLPQGIPRATQWHLTPLLLAATAAVIVRIPTVESWVGSVLTPWIAAAGTIVLALLHHAYQMWRLGVSYPIYRHLDGEAPMISTYLFIFWIVATVFHPRSLSARVLEWKPLRILGVISYSLYLWHVLVFSAWEGWWHLAGSAQSRWMTSSAVGLTVESMRFALAIGVAAASYYWLEKPLIRMGHRLAPSATIGRPEMLAGLPLETENPGHAAAMRHTT